MMNLQHVDSSTSCYQLSPIAH